MAQELSTTTFNVLYEGALSETQDLMGSVSRFAIEQRDQVTNGEGTNQANFVWSAEGKLGVGDSVTFDLYGTEKDLYNNTMQLDTLRAFVVRNTGDSSISVTTNGIGFLSGTTPKIIVGAESVQTVSNVDDGWAISDGSADTITLENEGTSTGTTYELMLLGTQAEESSSSSSFSSLSSENSSSSSVSSSSSDSSSSDSSSSLSSSSSSDLSSSSSSSLNSSSSSDSSLNSSSSSSSVITEQDMVLLAHFNGTDGATSARDWSNSEHPLTFNGNAQIDTAQSVFGGASLLLDGTGDYVSIPDSDDWNFGTGDLTIDFRVRFATVASTQFLVQQRADSSNTWELWFTTANGLRFVIDTSGSTVVDVNQGSSAGWSADTWYHVALVRDGNDWDIYRDGTSIASATDADGFADLAASLIIGANSGSSSFLNGWIDEFRILKGRAAWTSNFTPPTQEYKNAAASSSSSS